MSNASAAAQEITIQGAVFKIASPYAEGTKLKANEAAAMNQLFAENVRNNTAAIVKLAKAKVVGREVKDIKNEEFPGIELPEAEITRLQAEVETYANNYEFGARVGGRSKDPLERRIEDIAVKFFEQALRNNGITPSKLKKDNANAYNSALAQFIEAKREPFTKEAKAQLKKEQDLSNGILEGIDLSALSASAQSAGESVSEEEVVGESPAA